MATDKVTKKNKRKGPGDSAMGPAGISLVVGYTLVVMVLVIWTLVSLWPPIRPKEVHDRLKAQAEATPTPTPTPTPPPETSIAVTPTPTPTPTVTPSPTPTPTPVPGPDCEITGRVQEGFCLDQRGAPRDGVGAIRFLGRCSCIYDEDRLLLIVFLAGALGALVHALRSLSWYIGNREAIWSWSAMYFMLPFLGGGLAVIFYLVIRGGFFSPTSSVNDTSPFGFAALAALIGMFTEPAVLKLRKVATTILEPPEQGKDHVGPAPKVSEISPKQGSVAGGEPVTLTGENFSSSPSVTFGGEEAEVNSSTETSITVTTPAHEKGKVDVAVINEDTQQAIVKEGYEYIEPAGEPGGAGGAAGEGAGGAAGEAGGAGEGEDAGGEGEAGEGENG